MAHRPGFFSLRSFILAAIMVALYTLLVTAELNGVNPYAAAYQSRIGMYADKLDSLTRISSWERKMFLRHMANVEIPNYVARHLQSGDTVLLPPRTYAARYMDADPIWTDPRIFVYMAGFYPIVAYNDTARRKSANAFIALEPASIWIARRGGSTNIDSLLKEYEK